jgi:mRNA interferase MazF
VRPAVTVSRHDPDPPRALAIYIPSIPVVRLERRLGELPEKVVAEVRRALRFALDLGDPSKQVERRRLADRAFPVRLP